MKRFFLIILITFISLPAFSFDSQSTSFSVNAENKDINNITEVQKINELLDNLENDWNLYKIDNLIKYYADDFVNGDGLNIGSVKNLTVELWEAYPDIKTKSQDRTIRVYGEYATVESTDIFEGNSSMIRQEVGANGVLKAVSVGQVFLKKFGPMWKITSDKTIFERVSIGYALGGELIDQNKIRLSAPEQVPGGQQYTARLDFELPPDIKPVAAISKEVLVYPQIAAEDKFRLINEPKLERLIPANKNGKNELITATVGLTGGALKPKLLGLAFLTRRVNVVPVNELLSETGITKSSARSALNKSVGLLDFYQSGTMENEIEKNKNDKKQKTPETDTAPEIKE
ncbi:MAG: hypothetical protein A3I68_01200 [Candidatus Melainabacteria bacterium RIFCSPLOWO2_02_FULL_35_15]|nr:MAG: hypothetical protein A3F80_09045 [Candidatus Melainabacteria bacterium RIFCSPLOWO2_12_FULL_35_11]OGI13390.1 MAG: hypothetical protein A3I68_01200 [Candidatus Melainabacteria bacterium RIFCSPLOWO2_02_FULL_35_15]